MRRLSAIAIAAAVLIGSTESAESRTTVPATSESVVVSAESVASEDPYDIIDSNIRFLNALIARHVTRRQLSQDALRSYYVDYYLAQVNNGGFSQFVYNSRWSDAVVRYVREGLEAIGAVRHLELFDRNAAIVAMMFPDDRTGFLASAYFGENRQRDALNANNDEFYALSKREDLISLNAEWLRSRPNLVVMTAYEMRAELDRRTENRAGPTTKKRKPGPTRGCRSGRSRIGAPG